MQVALYLELINALFSLLIFLILIYLVWIIVNKRNVVRSIMFLKGDKFKNPTIFMALGVMLFSIKELYNASDLLGYQYIDSVAEIMELGSSFLFFIGAAMVFKLFSLKPPKLD